MQPAVQCRGIRKTYGTNDNKVEVLKGIDLEIDAKTLTLMVGPSGSGKTTLLSIIATILTADAGELVLLGHNVKEMNEEEKTLFRRDHLGIVFQSFFLIPTLTVAENVSLPLIVAGEEEEIAIEKAIVQLKRMGLANKHNVSPSNLSKGQQQRVAIARAIINESQLIVCDEPTSSLDHISGAEVMKILKELVEEASKTILVVTHDHRIFPFANRIVYMGDGQITTGDGHE